MAVKKIRYFTKERNDKVNPINRKRYDKYLKSILYAERLPSAE